MDIFNDIDKIIEENKVLIEQLDKKKEKEYTFDELMNLPFDGLEALLKKYNISDIAFKLDIIMNYRDILNKDEIFKRFFPKSISDNIKKISEVINEIIEKIKLKNGDINYKIEKLNDISNDLVQIKQILNSAKELNDIVNEINSILSKYISDANLQHLFAQLLPGITNYLLSEEKDKIKIDEEIQKEIPNTENIQSEINKKTIEILKIYQDSNSDYYIPNLSYEGLNKEELETVLELTDGGEYDIDTFAWLIGIYINEILTNSNEEKIKDYFQELERLTEIYIKSVDKKKIINEKVNELTTLVSTNYLGENYATEIFQVLDNIRNNQPFIITDEYYEGTINNLNKYIDDINNKIINQETKRPSIKKLSNFVLFAESRNNNPYFLDDLFDPKNNMIDNREFHNTEYFKEFNTLLLDLFEYGESSYLKSIDSKNSTKSDRMIMHIFYTSKKGIVDRTNPTDMWRIRPSLSSDARFVDVKVVIPNNTPIHKQIIVIITKYLPNVEIDPNQNFTFIVNIGAAVKNADDELYRNCIKRYDNIGIDLLKLFYTGGKYHKKDNGTLKSELTSEEYELLDEYVSKSIQVLKKLENIDDDFQFDPLLGGNKYGLSR